MDKIFHVFISSTYSDLIDERKKVSEAVAKAGFVAEGMEIFPAASQQQMEFIQRVIDRCDYYILILAGRYGSVASDGISYTEKEYRYAKSKGIPVLAFLHQNPDQLTVKNTEKDPANKEKLDRLIAELRAETLLDHYSNPDELATKALAALAQARAVHEGVGWIRGNQAATSDVLLEINTLRKQNAELAEQLKNAAPAPMFSDLQLAGLDEEFEVRYYRKNSGYPPSYIARISLSWREILGAIGPKFRTWSNSSGIENGLPKAIKNSGQLEKGNEVSRIEMEDKERILIQMEALGMMTGKELPLKNGGSAIFHRLTEQGYKEMMRANVVLSKTDK